MKKDGLSGFFSSFLQLAGASFGYLAGYPSGVKASALKDCEKKSF